MNISTNYKKVLVRSAVCLGVIALLGGCATAPHEHPDLKVNVEAVNSATSKAEAAANSANAAAKSAGDAAARAEAAAEKAEKAAAKAEAMFEKSMTK